MKAKAESEALACIILAAGKGTRMRSQTPKVLHKLAGREMVLHVLDTAAALHPHKTILVTSPDMNAVRDQVKSVFPKVEHAIQKEALGTGDAAKAAKSALKDFTGTVLVLYADTPLLHAETLKQLIAATKKKSAGVAVLGMQVTGANVYGRLLQNAKGELERIVEAKDASKEELKVTLCNSGVMAIAGKELPAWLSKLTNKNAKGEYYLTDVIALARKDKKICIAVEAEAQELLGINSRSELAQAEALMQTRLREKAMEHGVTLIAPETVTLSYDTKLGQDVTIYPHVVFGAGVKVENNVEIRSFSHIDGAKILANAIVGPFARLRPGAVIGESAHIGNFVEIKKSTIERGAKVNHLSYIGDSTIGENANIGAGTVTCNYDGYGKHRTHVGAGAFIGSNTALVAPVVVGEGAMVGAGSVITEDVEPEALAIARTPQKQKPGWAKNFRNKKNN